MSSEGRVAAVPLEKSSCNRCGYGYHTRALIDEDRVALYNSDYDLGLRDSDADRRRAANYGYRIDELLSRHGCLPAREISVAEFGSGTGALLADLTSRWPIRTALAVEPAPQLARVARANLLPLVTVREGFAEAGWTSEQRFDLCISVNVVEHALNPLSFLSACRDAIKDDGTVVAICPDGDCPNSELLFRDHVSSFSIDSLTLTALRAGLRVVASEALSGQLAGFRIFLLRRNGNLDATPHIRGRQDLSLARQGYLAGWKELEIAIMARLGGAEFAIFGIGEYADLLNAYCPDVTQRAKFYFADLCTQHEKNRRPVISTDEYLQEKVIGLAAVHPRSWRIVEEKFAAIADRFFHPYQCCSLRTNLA